MGIPSFVLTQPSQHNCASASVPQLGFAGRDLLQPSWRASFQQLPELLLIPKGASALLCSVITCHALYPPQQLSLQFLKGKIRNSGQMDIWENCW